VRDRFYDPHLYGLDWPAVRERYMPDATRASSEEALASVEASACGCAIALIYIKSKKHLQTSNRSDTPRGHSDEWQLYECRSDALDRYNDSPTRSEAIENRITLVLGKS
jgi:hypothetical protein